MMQDTELSKCGLVILAAGASQRLGHAKQLLACNERNLLGHSIHVALQSLLNPVVVVYGANAALVSPQLRTYPVAAVFNPDWEKGISSSINKGLSALLELSPSISAAIFMVCDQPFITSALLNTVIKTGTAKTDRIVACRYENALGSPALFGKHYFNELLELQGDEGAKKIIKKYAHKVSSVSFPMGHIDIDTKEDYELFTVLKNNGIPWKPE
jgi:molybdenum cofactor cytidylyltransferase